MTRQFLWQQQYQAAETCELNLSPPIAKVALDEGLVEGKTYISHLKWSMLLEADGSKKQEEMVLKLALIGNILCNDESIQLAEMWLCARDVRMFHFQFNIIIPHCSLNFQLEYKSELRNSVYQYTLMRYTVALLLIYSLMMVVFYCPTCKKEFSTSSKLSSHRSKATRCKPTLTLKPKGSKASKLKILPKLDVPSCVLKGKVQRTSGMDVTEVPDEKDKAVWEDFIVERANLNDVDMPTASPEPIPASSSDASCAEALSNWPDTIPSCATA
ncbi:hypothetical protein BDP27DRAFT_1370806 [Rhodocollybia butyracea]|uniref:C2H2-type domain-containing protein n=1 Tax=Rhodocollybia butyracea TaxID=206335 RepID=A0A9P5TZC2_9AGAR|nr:hypothetical protein BDP27DRAFT_1370806 [Rhodocollybia butyracea]